MEPEPQDRREIITGQFLKKVLETGSGSPSPGNDPQGTSSACRAGRSAGGLLQHFTRRAMACDFQFFFDLDPVTDFATPAGKAFDEIERIENLMTIYRPSPLVTVNQTAAASGCELPAELGGVIRQALELARATQGAYDITSTPLSRLWGFVDRKPRLPTIDSIAAVKSLVDWQAVELNEEGTRIRWNRPGMELNLNSIAKGYALDRAATILERCGVTRFILHGGQSSVVARTGQVPGGACDDTIEPSAETNSKDRSGDVAESWIVALTHPLVPAERIGDVELNNEALGTSGSARQAFYVQGRRLGHILDPRTGWPVENRLSVTVVHPRAAWSDALSTAFFVMSLDEIQLYCATRPETKALVFEHSAKSQRSWEAHSFNFNDQVRWI